LKQNKQKAIFYRNIPFYTLSALDILVLQTIYRLHILHSGINQLAYKYEWKG